jgi:hypothetical protein
MSGTQTTVEGPHPAGLPDAKLAKQCRVTFGRASGPGGQHRNKVETSVSILHEPTGIEATAAERRSQSQNQHMARRRLRLKLARKVRTAMNPKRYACSDLWRQRRQGNKLPVNPKHKDYAALLAEALDVVTACRFDVGGAAGVLGVTMSQLARLIRHDRHAFAWLNEGRTARGLPALK